MRRGHGGSGCHAVDVANQRVQLEAERSDAHPSISAVGIGGELEPDGTLDTVTRRDIIDSKLAYSPAVTGKLIEACAAVEGSPPLRR